MHHALFSASLCALLFGCSSTPDAGASDDAVSGASATGATPATGAQDVRGPVTLWSTSDGCGKYTYTTDTARYFDTTGCELPAYYASRQTPEERGTNFWKEGGATYVFAKSARSTSSGATYDPDAYVAAISRTGARALGLGGTSAAMRKKVWLELGSRCVAVQVVDVMGNDGSYLDLSPKAFTALTGQDTGTATPSMTLLDDASQVGTYACSALRRSDASGGPREGGPCCYADDEEDISGTWRRDAQGRLTCYATKDGLVLGRADEGGHYLRDGACK
ncbi:MAG: hypothetical protein R3F34_20295 [Planctomycetota bacterium]